LCFKGDKAVAILLNGKYLKGVDLARDCNSCKKRAKLIRWLGDVIKDEKSVWNFSADVDDLGQG
jgi:hypothetical protein